MKKRIFLSSLVFFCLSTLLLNSTVTPKSDIKAEAIPASVGSILDHAVFFGDSTTHGLIRYNVENNGIHGTNYHRLQRSQIWTPPDGTFYLGNLLTTVVKLPDGSSLPLREACRTLHPPYLIITVGINGLRTWQKNNFSHYYEKMLEIINDASPTTEIILQSVYPVAKERDISLTDFTPEKIDTVNQWIESIAKAKKLIYMNTASVLKDSEGYLRAEYQNGDGLHLNTLGFNTVLAYIEKSYNAS